ncbi:MAG TPA: hypothetical protein VMD91_17640 [Candidatus Sulfotelmatobacter sp.]|nr:hypothetical protein [Candidatus Sulfotelmatobacter sp.]
MRPGTLAHRDLFCRTFVETHVAFEPAELPWPVLDPTLLARVRSFPFWNIARSIEQRAGRMVSAFAQTLDDPVIADAVALQGVEETRHGRLMDHVCERYGIDAPVLAIPDAPATRDDFCEFGFGECRDSFIGFGALAIARERQLFPTPLLAIFDQVLWEEARHIMFFVNWWGYEEARAGRGGWIPRTLAALGHHAAALAGTVKSASEQPTGELDLSAAGDMLDGVTPVTFLEAALAENRRHMSKFDPHLLRPRLVPVLATAALTAIRLLPPRSDAAVSVDHPALALRARNAA